MKEISNAIGNQWKLTFLWLFGHIAVSLFPIYIGLFLLKLFSKPAPLSYFSNSGEFAIFSSSLIAISFYHILKDLKSTSFPHRFFFGVISFILIMIATILLAAVNMVNVLDIPQLVEMYDVELMRKSLKTIDSIACEWYARVDSNHRPMA